MDSMQTIEKWRVQELVLVLEQLSQILRKGNHTDWAMVFDHYHAESTRILPHNKADINKLRNLVSNIQNCFKEVKSFSNLEFTGELEGSDRNQEFYRVKARLFKLLEELQVRLLEYTH